MGGSAHPHLCFLSSALAMVLTAAGTLALCTSRCFLGLSAHTPSVVLDEEYMTGLMNLSSMRH